MHPVLLRFGSFEIHTYGLLAAAGFFAGILLAQWRAGKDGIAQERITDLGLWLIVSAMVGAKIFHILFFWDDVVRGWRESGPASLRAGFVFYGGFIGTTLTVMWYARRKQIPVWKLADILAPSLALGHGLGRLGCFFEGCCYGKACSLPWAVKFPATLTTVHPTQLYEAAGNFALFGILTTFYRHKRFDGQVWWLYVIAYACLRFTIEFFRGDYATHYFGIFTSAQMIAVVLVVVALVGKFRLESRSRCH